MIAQQEDIIGKVRISMVDLQRMLYLLLRSGMLNAELSERLLATLSFVTLSH